VANCWSFSTHEFLLYKNYVSGLANLLLCILCCRYCLIADVRDVMRRKIIWCPRGTNDAEPYKRISPLLPVYYNRYFALSSRRIISDISAVCIFLSTYYHNRLQETQDHKLCLKFYRWFTFMLICFLHCRSVQVAYHEKCTVENITLLPSAISALPNGHTCLRVLPVLLHDYLCLCTEFIQSTR